MKAPSANYWSVIEAGKAHHKNSKTWSGGLAVRHARRIKEFIDRIGAKSALDYGCGKGAQYMHLFDGKPLEEFWGIPVTKYDPALPEDWKESAKNKARWGYLNVDVTRVLPNHIDWDLLICTHVLGCIPPVDLEEWVIPLFHQRIKKGMYLAENLAPATKKVVRAREDQKALAREWGPDDWVKAVAHPKLELEFWFRGHKDSKKFQKWPFDEPDLESDDTILVGK